MAERKNKILEYLKQLNPNKLGLVSFGLVNIKEMNRGGFNINYLVDIDNHKFVFRFNIDKYLNVENQIEYENATLKCLEKSGIAPKVFFIDTNKNFFEQDLLVEEFIENQPAKCDNDFFKNFGKLVKKFHSISCVQNNLLIKNTNPLADQWNFIKKQIDFIESLNLNEKFLKFINPYITKVDKYVADFSNLFESKDICLNHRDLAIENVLQTDSGLKLIDWQTAMIDDPSYDLAYFTCYIDLEWMIGFRDKPLTNKEIDIFLSSYQINEKMLEKIHVRQPIVYLELFVWVAYRYAYLQNKLDQGLTADDSDKKYAQEIITVCKNFLEDENKMKKYLDIFYNYA